MHEFGTANVSCHAFLATCLLAACLLSKRPCPPNAGVVKSEEYVFKIAYLYLNQINQSRETLLKSLT